MRVAERKGICKGEGESDRAERKKLGVDGGKVGHGEGNSRVGEGGKGFGNFASRNGWLDREGSLNQQGSPRRWFEMEFEWGEESGR